MIRPLRAYRGEDINGAQIVHIMEIDPGSWIGVDFERSRGICLYSWENVITRLGDLIGAGHVYRLDGFVKVGAPFIEIDRAGNIWLDHEYLAPHQYLPLLIPEVML
jgi:hypothetical protein